MKEKAVLINLESRGPHLAGEEKSWNTMNAGHKRYKMLQVHGTRNDNPPWP